MAARCADNSVTDWVIVGAGDSVGEDVGVAVGSTASALTQANPKTADKTRMDTNKH
ncbi:MAG TPA: hypothetical protein VLK27_02035 [Chthoniobacterales bacterium]|nr:hypothetical protein [Chthoniobacterales bacterium]